MSDLIILGGTVISMNGAGTIYQPGAVAVTGNSISDIGPLEGVTQRNRAERVIEAYTSLILPGLVSTHTHQFQVLLRGLGDELPLAEWLERATFPMAAKLNAERAYVGARLCCLEMIKTGTTCFSDSHYVHVDKGAVDSIAGAVEESGLRAVIGRSCMDEPGVPDIFREEPETAMKETERAISTWNGRGGGRIRVCPEAVLPLFCSSRLIQGLRAIADKYGTGYHFHAAETASEVALTRRRTGKGVVEYLDFLGVLAPDLLLAHAIWLSDHEIKLMAEKGVKVAHNPVSNQYLADGVAPVPRMLEEGIVVGLGPDGASSNNDQDMFKVMKHCALMHKVSSMNAGIITAERVLTMATRYGAKALGLEQEVGTLEVGKRADIIIIDLRNKPNLAPNLRPVSNLVYAASGGDVDTVLVDGQVLMDNRRVLTMNEGEVISEANRVAFEMVREAGLTHLLERRMG